MCIRDSGQAARLLAARPARAARRRAAWPRAPSAYRSSRSATVSRCGSRPHRPTARRPSTGASAEPRPAAPSDRS
eukprot:1203085-Prymnesium_polylepis.1